MFQAIAQLVNFTRKCLPMATEFQEMVAMDLKFYSGKILNLVDHST